MRRSLSEICRNDQHLTHCSRRGLGQKTPSVIRHACFRLTKPITIHNVKFEHWRFDAKPRATLSPTSAIQGSASVLGVHARSSGSPIDYAEPPTHVRRG